MTFSNRFPRVLCVTLRAGSVGHAVLDGFGIADDSFHTTRLDHLRPRLRYQRLVKLIRLSCRVYRPTRIVLGLPGLVRKERRALAERLARRFRTRRMVVSVQRLATAARILFDHFRYRRADELVERLSTHFLPDLVTFVARTRASPSYWRAAWYAAAIALADLTEHHPFDAAALARPSAFGLSAFRLAIARALTSPRPYAT